MSTGFTLVVDAIKSQPTVAQAPNLATFKWTPVVQGLVSGVAAAFGGTVNFPSAPSSPTPPFSAPPFPLPRRCRVAGRSGSNTYSFRY